TLPFRTCPPLDFSIPEVRENVAVAISRLETELSRSTPFYAALINGKKATTGKTLPSRNPAISGQILGEVAQCSEKEVNEAISAAMAAREKWKKTPSGERAALLFRTAHHLEKERSHLMAFEIMEAGKSWREADGDICEAIDFLRYYAGEMTRLDALYRNPGTVSSIPGEENRLIPQPLGIMAAIPPWNFPLALATGMIAAGVVAGNCVIFKPSSLSQVLGAKIMEAFLEAGIPPGVLQFLPGEGKSVGELLVRHPQIALIAFTGSNEVGRHILSSAATLQPGQKQFKRVIAEMGGKNAIIVDDGADLDEAVSGVVASAFGYQGQKCSACSRVIVLRSVYADFTRRLVSATEDLVRGDPRSPSVFMGPVIDEKARMKIKSYIKLGIETAKPLYVRKEADESGCFIGPAIFDNVSPESPLAQEEIFGPVLSVFQAETFDDALRLANDSLFGLTGGLYSRKPSHIEKAREAFHAGNLYINRKTTGAIVGRQPFGGFNLSGVGAKTGGPDYLLQFMQVKSVSENTRRKGYIP
ncbi:MAG TPA: L-glutamate gamma-semialdehyde dehydrogenase, partial [Nitrospiria bacterium]|nr:L-glutamate gamma-semialdehyde dehydrogenase [Nitrospiria bacterium]